MNTTDYLVGGMAATSITDAMEFWQGRESRLHDRLLYTRDNDKWRLVRLAP